LNIVNLVKNFMRPLQPSFHKYIQVLVLYLGLHGEPLTIRALLRLTDDDDIIGRRLYDTVSMNVYVRLDGFFLLRRPGASALMCFLGQPQIPPSQQCYP